MDESAEVADTGHHVIFIRGVDPKFQVSEELASVWNERISRGTLAMWTSRKNHYQIQS
jgi:hypothetical protein